jgi:hypothetical protein
MSASSAACLIRIDHFMFAATWNAGRRNLSVHAQGPLGVEAVMAFSELSIIDKYIDDHR